MIFYNSDFEKVFDWTLENLDVFKTSEEKVLFLKTVINVLNELIREK